MPEPGSNSRFLTRSPLPARGHHRGLIGLTDADVHEAHAPLPLLQPAGAGADVALDPPLDERVPVACRDDARLRWIEGRPGGKCRHG